MNSRIRRPSYISLKSWLCCCSLPTVAPQQLDLYAPFDTMDHAILPTRLSQRFLIKVLFSSYLSEPKQFVSVNGTTSSHRDLPNGIPQGSFLGSMLFLMYTAPLADVIRKHDMWFHLYAEDTQIYLSFELSIAELPKTRIEAYVSLLKWYRHVDVAELA